MSARHQAAGAIAGVRIATAADIAARRARREAPPPPTTVEPSTAAETQADQPAATSGSSGVASALADGSVTAATAGAAAGSEGGEGPWRAPPGGFRADTPGYHGRIFGEISVKSASGRGTYYGRIHLFQESSWYRDYSAESLFGYEFQHELPNGGVRDFQTGRAKTPGAYLMVTDLYSDAHISTMGHTVIFVFPRIAPEGGDLYTVGDDPEGNFTLRGPAGSLLRFDGRTGALRQAAGFVVSPRGDSGTPPRVDFRGLSMQLHAVGQNPFLRGRPATVVDARGGQCQLSTSDLFVYEDRMESDVFRFPDDGGFFRFLVSRCPWLDLPKPAEPRTVAAVKPRPQQNAAQSGGLIPGLVRAFH